METQTMAKETWNGEETMQLRRTAWQLLGEHDCQGHRDQLSRENCGACTLNGYRPKDADYAIADGPNYSGWARVYIQAGRAIPRKWREAFKKELASDNTLYAEALRKDIATFGMAGRVNRIIFENLL